MNGTISVIDGLKNNVAGTITVMSLCPLILCNNNSDKSTIIVPKHFILLFNIQY